MNKNDSKYVSHISVLAGPLRQIVRLLIVAGLIILSFLGKEVYDQLQVLKQDPIDNVQWNLSQLEVEALQLSRAAETALLFPDERSLNSLRLRFDVYYSRLKNLQSSAYLDVLSDTASIKADLEELQIELDNYLPLIDATIDVLKENLTDVVLPLRKLPHKSRGPALKGLELIAKQTTAMREEFANLLVRTAIAAGVLILALGATLLSLGDQFRIAQKQTREANLGKYNLAAAVSASLDAIIIADEHGTVLEYNEAAAATFGHPREIALGQKIDALVLPKRIANSARLEIVNYLTKGQHKVLNEGRVELVAIRSDGSTFPAEMSVGSALSTSGPIFIAYIRDISARRKLLKRLRKARDKALTDMQAKSRFLAVMSHEMRTPLNGILGVMQLFRDTKLTKQQNQYVDIASSSGEILLTHINKVLDSSMIDQGRLVLRDDAFCLQAILEETIGITVTESEIRGNELILESDLTSKNWYFGDKIRVQQILLNLIGNANKFTDDGEITIEANFISKTEKEHVIELAVTDTGIGISEDDQKNVFEQFVTLDASYKRNTSGTGLGLNICQKLALAIGGRIGVKSVVGKGSRFWLHLPLKIADPDDIVVVENTDLEIEALENPLNVLVVEDNEINRFVVRNMLEQSNCVVDEAEDGETGVAMAAAKAYDFILMDISMPGMDGMEATQAILEGPTAWNPPKIFGLTAHAGKEELRRFQQAGMETCITKPLRRQALQMILNSVSPQKTKNRLPPKLAATAELLANKKKYIDSDVLEELTSFLDSASLETKLQQFEEDLVTGLENAKEAISKKDGALAAAEVHKPAGVAAIFGLVAVHKGLAKIERACEAGDFTKTDALMKDVLSLWEKSRPQLIQNFELLKV